MSETRADTIPEAAERPHDGGRHLLLAAGVFLAISAVLWLALFAIQQRCPLLRPGSDVIMDAKLEMVAAGGIFREDANPRVVVAGNSRTLAGFIPAQFDAMIGETCQSFNLGLPGSNAYLEPIKTLIANGDIPTHILIQAPWPPATTPPGLSEWRRRDKQIVATLFPFRDLPRNVFIFLVTSLSRGGPAAYGRQIQATTEAMIAGRGYYFIEGQSRYPNHRLPDDFTLPADTPETAYRRDLPPEALAFRELRALAERYKIHLVVIPEYYRRQALANSAQAAAVHADLNGLPHVTVVGPEYFRYSNDQFSDHVHLNREGATAYTADLGEALASILRPASPADNGGNPGSSGP